jgi:Predicted permeases
MIPVESLEHTAILFGFILVLGFVAGKAKLLPRAAKSGMTNLVLYITLPCLIVTSFNVAYNPALLKGLVTTFAFAATSQVIVQILSLIFFRKEPFERRSVYRYGLICANSSFFGIPMLHALFGFTVLPFGAVYLIPQRIAMWTFGIQCFSNELDKKIRLNTVIKTFVHPAMIAVYIGLFIMLSRNTLPTNLADPIEIVGSSTMPITMILIGSIIVELKPSMLLDKQLYLYSALRLIVVPGLIFLLCLLFGQTGMILQVCVLMAGMPAPTTTSLLALRYGANEVLGSTQVIFTTILFFALLPLWFTLFSLVG